TTRFAGLLKKKNARFTGIESASHWRLSKAISDRKNESRGTRRYRPAPSWKRKAQGSQAQRIRRACGSKRWACRPSSARAHNSHHSVEDCFRRSRFSAMSDASEMFSAFVMLAFTPAECWASSYQLDRASSG